MFFCGQKVKSQGHCVLYNMSPQHNVLMWFLLYCYAQQNVQDYFSLTARSNIVNILKFEEIIYKNRKKSLLKMNPQIPAVWLIFTGLQTIEPFLETWIKFSCVVCLLSQKHRNYLYQQLHGACWPLLPNDLCLTVHLLCDSHWEVIFPLTCPCASSQNVGTTWTLTRRSCFAFYRSKLLMVTT